MAKKRSSVPVSQRKRGQPAAEGGKLPGWSWFALGGALLILLVAGLMYLGQRGQASARGGLDGLVVFPDPGRGHQEGDIEYADLVPVGGTHNPEWLNCGIYEEPVRPENAIHSMEHGAVWIAYRPDLPAAQVDTLRDLVRQEQNRRGERLVLLAPQPGLDVPIVATAWRVQLKLENALDERLPRFLELYQRGPFYPEPGASCTFGGIGQPVS